MGYSRTGGLRQAQASILSTDSMCISMHSYVAETNACVRSLHYTDWIQLDNISMNTVFILPMLIWSYSLASNSKDRVLALGRVEPCIHSTYMLSGEQLDEGTGSSCLCVLSMKQTGLCANTCKELKVGVTMCLTCPDLSKCANPRISILGLCYIIYVCHCPSTGCVPDLLFTGQPSLL